MLGVVNEFGFIPDEINELWMRCFIVALMSVLVYMQPSYNKPHAIHQIIRTQTAYNAL